MRSTRGYFGQRQVCTTEQQYHRGPVEKVAFGRAGRVLIAKNTAAARKVEVRFLIVLLIKDIETLLKAIRITK